MIYIVRHGQTDWNVEKKVQGRFDNPLNETGLLQATETKNKLLNTNIDLIICSPLLRAKQTADIINENRNITIIYDDRIIERSFGELEGTQIEDIDFNSFWDYYKNIQYKSVESMQSLFDRIYDFLKDIEKKYKNKDILLVTHGGVGMPVDCFFQENIPEGSLMEAGLQLKNCEVKSYEF